MPKLKTNRAAKKRFRTTKSGKVKYSKSFARHLLTGKSAKRRRNLGKAGILSPEDTVNVKRMLPYD